jgi:ribosomal protein L1
MVSISDTLSQAGGNFARPTKYNIVLSTPPALSQYNKVFDILGKSVSVPDVTNTPIEFKIKGQNVKIPGRTQQTQEVQITFYLDEGLKIRNLFQDWLYSLDPRSPVPMNTNSYNLKQNRERFGNLVVLAQDFKEENSVSAYMFEGVFPTNVGSIEYSSADKDTVIELTVTFSYYRFITQGDFTENIDDYDNFLDTFGVIPKVISGSVVTDISNLFNDLNNGISAIGSITDLFR